MWLVQLFKHLGLRRLICLPRSTNHPELCTSEMHSRHDCLPNWTSQTIQMRRPSWPIRLVWTSRQTWLVCLNHQVRYQFDQIDQFDQTGQIGMFGGSS